MEYSLDAREMEEEEKYLACLKEQREKIEVFRKEALKKDRLILESHEEIELL